MGSSLLPALRVDRRRGLPPGGKQAASTPPLGDSDDPSENRTSATVGGGRGREAEGSRTAGTGRHPSASVFEPTLRPAPPHPKSTLPGYSLDPAATPPPTSTEEEEGSARAL